VNTKEHGGKTGSWFGGEELAAQGGAKRQYRGEPKTKIGPKKQCATAGNELMTVSFNG